MGLLDSDGRGRNEQTAIPLFAALALSGALAVGAFTARHVDRSYSAGWWSKCLNLYD